MLEHFTIRKGKSMSEHPICHVEIPAADPATASAFYAEVFGWKIEVDSARTYHMFEPQGGPGGAFVQVGETTSAKIGEVLIYISTDDIDATLAKAEALGAKTLTPKTEIPHTGWFAVFTDPASNRIALYTALSHS
jgi:predicted enzyme related to lactoylglutathione lyase